MNDNCYKTTVSLYIAIICNMSIWIRITGIMSCSQRPILIQLEPIPENWMKLMRTSYLRLIIASTVIAVLRDLRDDLVLLQK